MTETALLQTIARGEDSAPIRLLVFADRALYLQPALPPGLLEMTVPDTPNSRAQRYRLNVQGQAWLAHRTHGGTP